MKERNVKKECSRCGADLGDRWKKQRYCRKCHAYMSNKAMPHYKDLSEERKKKLIARGRALYFMKKHGIERQPCKKCGNPKGEMHHDDYSNPLEITWLCRKCHLIEHGSAPYDNDYFRVKKKNILD